MSSSGLQRELKKRQPFAQLEMETALSVLRTGDQLHIRLDRLFREHGLTSSQYNVLRILRGEGKPLPILEIAARTVTVVPGITGLIDRLECAGYVCRERSAEDRRVIFVSITDKAQKALEDLDQPLSELHRFLVSGLSAIEQQELVRLLEKMRQPLLAKDD